MIDENERLGVEDLFLLAGKKAMASVVPNESFAYFSSGIELLHGNSWGKRYHLILNVHCNAAKWSS